MQCKIISCGTYSELSTRSCCLVYPYWTSSMCYKISTLNLMYIQVEWSRYRTSMTQRVGRGIALLFHDRGTGRGWVVSSTPRLHFTPGKDPVPILQETGWAQGRSGRTENLVPTGILSRTFQPVAQSLHRLSYRAHNVYTGRFIMYFGITKNYYRKTIGHVFTKPVQIEGETQKRLFPPLSF